MSHLQPLAPHTPHPPSAPSLVHSVPRVGTGNQKEHPRPPKAGGGQLVAPPSRLGMVRQSLSVCSSPAPRATTNHQTHKPKEGTQ